jgi:hypothetical protein
MVMLRKTLYQALTVVALFLPAMAMTDDDVTLKTIMQGLRDNLVEISDGLLTDDFALVSRGASAIAEHPQIPAAQVQLVAAELGQEMPAFKQLDTLVHDLSLEIDAAARANDWGAATSAYQQMFDGCLACHERYKERVVTALSTTTDP